MKDIIRHLVISGGGETGFTFYGILRETHRQGLWDIKNLVSTHGTSIGAVFAVIICFAEKLGWDTIDDYLYLRPWSSIFNFGIDRLISSFDEIGILNVPTIEKTIHPLLHACDLSPDITLAEYYEFTGIDCHIYCTCLDTLELVDISHKTHPTWKLTEAVYCSSALPVLFRPYKKDGKTYLDGAVMGNYPVLQCLKMGAKPSEILGIQKTLAGGGETSAELNFANMPDYLFTIMAKLLEKVSLECPSIPYQVDVPCGFTNIYKIYEITHDYTVRKDAIEWGIQLGKEFLERMSNVADSPIENSVDAKETPETETDAPITENLQ